MLLLRHPSEELILSVLQGQLEHAFTYEPVGGTRSGNCPNGYSPRRQMAILGQGETVFEQAKLAMQRWKMFDLGWVSVCPDTPAIQPGVVLGTLARVTGLWALNVARIVYVIDEPQRQFGFGYGTLPEHAIRGEERFLLSLDPETGQVRYEIFSFSRPLRAVAWAELFYLRALQRRFCVESAAAMIRAVE
jgi:uncharacterized protein (UPF0548 family)